VAERALIEFALAQGHELLRLSRASPENGQQIAFVKQYVRGCRPCRVRQSLARRLAHR
jgi:hypothetical protein